MASSLLSLHVLIREAFESPTLDAVAVALARMLEREDRHPAFVSISRYDEEGKSVSLARWTAVPSSVVPGMSVAPQLTPDLEETIRALKAGRPQLLRLAEKDYGLMGDLLRAEGAVTVLSLPIHGQNLVFGSLSLGSSSETGFTEHDLPLFIGVGRGIEHRIIELAEQRQREAPSRSGT